LGPEALAPEAVGVEKTIGTADTGLHTTVGNAKNGKVVTRLVVVEVA
jgi:hypothetical protein